MTELVGNRTLSSAKILIAGATPFFPGEKYGQAQSSSVAQAPHDLELWDCCSLSCRGGIHFAMAGAPFTGCSRVALSLRGNIECLVRWSRAGIARDGSLSARFLLLLLAADLFVGCKT